MATKTSTTPTPARPVAERLQSARAYRDACSEVLSQRQAALDALQSRRATLDDVAALRDLRSELLDAEDHVIVARATLAKASADVTALEAEANEERRKRDEARHEQLEAEAVTVRERLRSAINEVDRHATALRAIRAELGIRDLSTLEIVSTFVALGTIKSEILIPHRDQIRRFNLGSEDRTRIEDEQTALYREREKAEAEVRERLRREREYEESPAGQEERRRRLDLNLRKLSARVDGDRPSIKARIEAVKAERAELDDDTDEVLRVVEV